MAMRLKIGTYIIDADSDSSTTTGVSLALGDADADNLGALTWNESRDAVTLNAFAFVTASDTATLKTRLSALRDAVVNVADVDVVIEYADGTTFKDFKVSNGDYRYMVGTIQPDVGETDAVVLITITMTGFEAARTGSGGGGTGMNPEGLTGGIQFQYERNIAGAAALIATAQFKHTATNTSLVNAKAWVALMVARTGTPTFMAPANELRKIQDDYEFMENDIARATVLFREMPTALKDLNTAIKGVSYTVSARPRTLTSPGGRAPGLSIAIQGVIQFKTEGNTTFESGDTKTAPTPELINAAIGTIRSDAESRIGQIMEQTGREVSIPGESGDVSFSVTGITIGSGVIEWDESLEIRADDAAAIVPNTKGGDHVYEHAGDVTMVATHTMRVEAFGATAYKKPSEFTDDPRWRAVSAQFKQPQNRWVDSYGDGSFRSVINEYAVQYRLVRNDEGETASTKGVIEKAAAAAGATVIVET